MATHEINTLSLHDALPISSRGALRRDTEGGVGRGRRRPCRRAFRAPDGARLRGRARGRALALGGKREPGGSRRRRRDRKSTRLNSSHSSISYAVFCLKKKK